MRLWNVNVAQTLEQTRYFVNNAAKDPNMTMDKMVAIIEAMRGQLDEIFSGEVGKGRNNQYYQALAKWESEFGDTKEKWQKKAEDLRDDAIDEMKKENNGTIDNVLQLVDPNGYQATLNEGIDLENDTHYEYARGVLIDSSFWHFYHNDDGTQRAVKPDLIDIVNMVTAKHAGSVSPEQLPQLRRIISALIRTESGKISANNQGWLDKYRGRYGDGALGATQAPLSFTIGGNEISLLDMDVDDNVVGTKILQASAKAAGGNVNPAVVEKYRATDITFDGSVTNVVESFLARRNGATWGFMCRMKTMRERRRIMLRRHRLRFMVH